MPMRLSWKRIRKFLNDVHLWLGLASGIVLFLICFTGTVYTFHTEIDHWFNKDKYEVEPAANALSMEQLTTSLKAEVEGEVVSVRIFPAPEQTYQFYIRKEGERRRTTYLVNQYSGEVLGDTKSNASAFFMTMFRLHRWLLLDIKVGRPIVGWSTVLFVFLIVTGLVIWVPQKAKAWRQGLKIKWSGNWKRINHDLHNALGFYTAIFLLLMALTGLQWSFTWYRTGLRQVLGVEQSSKTKTEAPAGVPENQQPLPLEELMATVDVKLPHQGAYRIYLPDGENADIKIYKYHAGFFASPASDVVSINAYTGVVNTVEVFADKPFNEKVARSIKALHVGDVFGTFSKIIYFISCLIATTLPVTGTLIWINKLKKKPRKQFNKLEPAAQMAQ